MSFESDIFCFDTSIFINFHRHYPGKVMPDLWIHLDQLIGEGRIISHEVVLGEVCAPKGTDNLETWLMERKQIFQPMTSEQTTFLPAILSNFPKLHNYEAEREQADVWLVAMLLERKNSLGMYGSSSNFVIATAENPLKSTKLPAACKHFGVHYCDQFEFFNRVGIRFAVTRDI